MLSSRVRPTLGAGAGGRSLGLLFGRNLSFGHAPSLKPPRLALSMRNSLLHWSLSGALKRNRHGHRDWLIGLLIFRHGLRVSEACDLRWDDIDLKKRTIIVRRLKGSTDSSHYLERDEHRALGELWRTCAAKGIKAGYVFVNERGHPFGRMGIARMIERAGEAAKLPFPIHVHMLRHSTGYALAARGMDTRRLQHYLGHASITNTVRYTAMSPEPFKDIWRE
jgi:site-specific recombinase XerD